MPEDTATPTGESAHPEQIGPYRILDVLGEGGMGTVFLAEQKKPVRRRVALKVIKLGMDTKEVLNRFEAERQALAMMQHGSIARVLDAGATEGGRPYFAMEHVKGVPITQYCDDNKLGISERISLFKQVCSGVQHAHQKGVIHRDLKPGNVLVTTQDGDARTKIIDFGLARATDHQLIEATLYTQQGQTVGTPEYMSPEQAGLGGLDIDTRTDVYSLGVLLYELLTGTLPFPTAELRLAGLLEIQRKIREDDPPKPSTRLAGGGEDTAMLAARRRIDTPALLRRLRGELDWIVMRAMEKDRTRRYETANALAMDLQRHLDDEPVLASPPSASYRARKLIRRYRGQFVAAVIVLVVLVGGIVGTSIGLIDAAHQQTLAEAATQHAREGQARAAIAVADSALRFRQAGRARLWLAEVPEPVRGWEWRHLNARSDGAWKVLDSGSKSLFDASYSPDCSRVATTSWTNNKAILWDAESGNRLHELVGHTGPATLISFSADGSRMATAADDQTVRVWDVATGEGIHVLHHVSQVWRVSFSPVPGDNRLVTTGLGAAVLWDGGGERIRRFSCPVPQGPRARYRLKEVFSPDGTKFVVSAENGTAVVRDSTTGEVLHALEGHEEIARPEQFSADGQLVLTVDGGGVARIWNLASPGGPPVELRGHDKKKTGDDLNAALDPTGTRVVSGAADMTARIWDASSGKELHVLQGHTRTVRYVAFSPDGTRVLTGSHDGTVGVWDAASGEKIVDLIGHMREIMSADFDRDGDRVLTSANDGTARIWDLRRDFRIPAAIAAKQAGKVLDVALSPTGVRAVTVTEAGAVRVFTRSETVVLEDDAGAVAAVFCSRAASVLAGDATGRVRAWTVDGQSLGTVIPGGGPLVSAMAFAPDGDRVVVGYENGMVRLRSVRDPKAAPLDLAGPDRIVAAVRFSPDGTQVLVGYYLSRMARIWDATSGAEIRTFAHDDEGGYESVLVLTYSPDGTQIFTGGGRDDHDIYVRDPANFQETGRLIGHAIDVRSLSFSPDGTRIVTASDDMTARIWNPDTGTELLSLRHSSQVRKAVFSTDGTYIVTHSADNTVSIWDSVPARERRR